MSRIPSSTAVWMGDLEAKVRPLKADDVRLRLSQAGVPDEKHDAIVADLSRLPMDLQAEQATWDAGGDAAKVRDHIRKIRAAAQALSKLFDDPLAKPAMTLARDRACLVERVEYYETVRGLSDALLTTDILFRFVENEMKVSAGGKHYPQAQILAGWTVVIFQRHGLPIDATRKGLLTQVFGQVLEAANMKLAHPHETLRKTIQAFGPGKSKA